MTGNIFDIKRFAVHDGCGIRTTLFLKGCPLKCRWCHNPEGISRSPVLMYLAHKCVSCGKCAAVCPHGAHVFSPAHTLDREQCHVCGRCVAACSEGALIVYGKTVTAEEILPDLLRDRDFYESSGGGVTLSGGECLLQPDFCAALLSALKREGIHTCVDTCGYVPREAFDAVIPYTDLFLYDIKAIDSDVHKRCTGVDNGRILENLRYLDSLGCKTEIRIPFVPDCNDGEIPKIADFLSALHHVTGVRVLPYHNFASSKYASLAMPDTLPKRLPTKEEIADAEAYFNKF